MGPKPPARARWSRLQRRWQRLLDQIDEMGIIDFDTDDDEPQPAGALRP